MQLAQKRSDEDSAFLDLALVFLDFLQTAYFELSKVPSAKKPADDALDLCRSTAKLFSLSLKPDFLGVFSLPLSPVRLLHSHNAPPALDEHCGHIVLLELLLLLKLQQPHQRLGLVFPDEVQPHVPVDDCRAAIAATLLLHTFKLIGTLPLHCSQSVLLCQEGAERRGNGLNCAYLLDVKVVVEYLPPVVGFEAALAAFPGTLDA